MPVLIHMCLVNPADGLDLVVHANPLGGGGAAVRLLDGCLTWLPLHGCPCMCVQLCLTAEDYHRIATDALGFGGLISCLPSKQC